MPRELGPDPMRSTIVAITAVMLTVSTDADAAGGFKRFERVAAGVGVASPRASEFVEAITNTTTFPAILERTPSFGSEPNKGEAECLLPRTTENFGQKTENHFRVKAFMVALRIGHRLRMR